jgi:predicted Fe-Mo cluster-binding NifX family protein
MKICVSASGPSESASVDFRFGRCPYFIIYDADKKKYAVVKNEAVTAFRGAGITAAQKVADLGCQVIITGNIGPNAFGVLSQSGIKIFTGIFNKIVKETIEDWENGKLKESGLSTASFGPGRGFGGGRGGGWGRGRQ